MEEEWKLIKDFPKYSVSNYGRVRRDSTGRILAHTPNQYGVVCVGLMRDHRQYNRSVPRLVARTFIPRPLGAFDTPINLNGDRYNNYVDNLMWRPRWFAVQYNRQFHDPYPNPIDRSIRDKKTQEIFPNSFSCAIRFGILEKDVVLSILNRTYAWPTYQQFEIVE